MIDNKRQELIHSQVMEILKENQLAFSNVARPKPTKASSSFFHAGCVELEIVVGAGIGLLENATFTLLDSNAFVTSAAISCTFHFSFAKEETPPCVFVLSKANKSFYSNLCIMV